MNLPIERRGDTLVVHVDGQLTVSTRLAFRQRLLDQLERGERKLLVDFRETAYIDSSGLGVLVSAAKKARERGGDLRLANLSLDLKELFRLTKLDALFTLEGGWDDEEG